VACHGRHSSSPELASELTGLGDLGFLVQNGEEDKGILTRGSLTAGWVPRWLTAVGTLLHSFGSAGGASKVSPVLKIDVEWWRLLLKFLDTFNCGERRGKSVHDSGGLGKSGGSVWVQNLHDIGHYL
jgi:hypothetical protein